MTEQEKESQIRNLKMQVEGAISYLLILRKVAEEQGSMDAFPVFGDFTVKTILEKYEELQKVRGY